MGKELTPQLIKKLEENANLMMSKGFSEADIQDMSAQFIEEFGVEKVVKKKEDTIKSGSGFSMLSGTESKSKSPEPSKPTQSQTKAINTNPTMPDFGLKLGFPIQKPTINLKTTEQEQRIIKSKESNQTPQVFEDYRSVIQKGIQGQNKMDATFQPLSKPIVEAQAKKEVQQLKEQQQATKLAKKLAKKETHQNILAFIPELAQAKNTDEAISTILKSDMKDNFDMWQQFDDNTLLNNDESTLNDFLVKKGLKNADREAYLKGQSESNPKYQYEYERNNISSLFGAVAQRAKDYEDVLKNKFGDNYLQQANAGNENILNDTEFNTFISLKEKEKSLSTKANSLINDPRFSSIKKELDKNEDKQLKSDAIAKADKWYNPTDELRYVGSKVLYAAGKAVKMLAELPSLATSIDKGYDWTDKLADWGDRFSTDLIDAIPVSTDLKAGFNNKVAKVGNYKVIIDDNGEVADVRDNNNFKVSLDEMKSVTDKYNANPKGYKVNNEYNPRSLADNGLNTVIDMGLMILGTKGAGVLGAGKKMQKLTSMGIAYQQTKRDVFNDALKKGLDPKNADLLSNIIAVAAGASSSINPLEYNIASGKGLFNFLKTDGLNAGKLALIKEGKLSVKDYAKEFVKAGIKNTIGENIEELGIENTTQAIANNYFDNKISATDKTDGGLDDKLHIFDKQGLETFLITAGTSLLMTPIEMKSQMLGNQQEALKLAIDNPIDFKKIRQIQVEKGQLTQDEVDKEAKIYEDVSRTYNASKDEIKEELKPQLLALLTKKYNIANKINEIKDDVLSAPYKAQLNDINKGIQDITNGIIPNESLVENTVTTTSVDDNNQEQEQEQDTDNNTNQSTIIGQAAGKGGVSILTKEKIRIANKISKGEDLTPEESDFYKAVKEDIDKITAGSITPTQQTTTSKLDNDVRLIEITPEDRKEMPKQLSTSQKKEYINLATQSEKDEYLLKIKQGNEQIQATPIESIESGQEVDNSTGFQQSDSNNGEVQQGDGTAAETGQQPEVEQQQAEPQQKVEPQPAPVDKKQKAASLIQQLGLPKKQKVAEVKPEPTPTQQPMLPESTDVQDMSKKEQEIDKGKSTWQQEQDAIDSDAALTPMQKQEKKVEVTAKALEGIPVEIYNKKLGSLGRQNRVAGLYHKYKADGSNPQLVEAVEKLLNDNSTTNAVNNPVSEVVELKENEQKKPLNEQKGENKQGNKGLNEQKTLVSKTETTTQNSENNTKFDNNVTKSTDKTKTIDATTESGVRENTESSTEEKSEEKGANTKPTKSRVKGTPKSRRKVKHPEYLRALSHEPETATDIVLQAFISGAKIKADIIKKLYRNSGREIKQRIGLLSNGGYSTMAEMAHSLWEDQESFFGFEKFDSQEFENAIEDVLNSHTGTRSMVDELNNKFGLTADEKDAEEYAKYQEYEQKAEQEDLDEAIVYYESLTEEELLEIANAKDSAFIDDYVTYAEGKNNELAEERKQPADRTAKEIEAELKVKNAELKKLEEKQSKLNAQLEKNLKENQLDLLQGAKPQAMFDDRVEQQKIAESVKEEISNKRKEIAKLQDELDNINQIDIPFSAQKPFKTISTEAFTKLLDKLKKAFPNVKVELFGKGNMESAKKALEEYGLSEKLKTPNGTIYGFKTPDGKVFINTDQLNANTPIHEFAHVWQEVFPQGFARGIELLKLSPQGQALIKEIQKNPAYKGKSLADIQAEALVTAIGNKGEGIFNSNPTLWNRFKEWLSDFFKKIGDKLGIKDLSPDDKLDMFTKKVVGELLGGKVLSSEEKAKQWIEDKYNTTSTQHSIDITPEMKAEVETGMPLFQYRKSELQSAVDAMRNDGMTDEEIRKFLDAIEQPKEEIDSVLEKQPKEKEKRLLNKAFKGTTDEELKSLIEDYGLTYDTESQIIAEEEANDIINIVGLEKAFQAVQNGYINGAQAAVVYAKMVDHIEAQLQKGNLSDEELVKLKELQAYTIDIFDNAARDAGRFIAMLKRVYHKSLFTYDAMVKSAENAKGTPLTEEERLIIKEQAEKIAELDKTIKELEEKLEQERAENAVQKIKADINKPKPTSVSFKAKAKAFADKIRGLKTKGLVLKDADGNPINITQNSIVSYNEIIEMVAKTIEKTGDVLEGITVALSEVKKQDWYQKLTQRDKDAVDKQIKQDILDLDEDVSDDKFKIPHSLIREIVKNGTEDIDGIVKKVLEVYHDIYTDLDERKVRDIITKYGEQKIDTRDDIDKKISEAKRIGRHLSGKEDLLNGKPPKRSGFKRDKPTPTERLLMKEIQQLLKNIPKAQEEIDNLWTTALEKAKTRITNRIEELQLAIDKKERINKTKNVQNYNDTDLDKLKDDLKAKQKEYDDLFPKEKTELSDEQRLIQSVNAKKTQLKTLQSQKDSKVYERNKKDAPDRSKFPKLDKEIKDLDDKIKEIKEEIKQDDSWVKHIEKKRISLAIKANQRRIEEYRRRINEKDFVVVKNPTPISDELTKVRRKKQKVADDYEQAKHKYELENRTLGQKIFDGLFEGMQLPKQLVATADLSAPLRQGATVMFSNPIIWAKAFWNMHGQAFSHKLYENSINNIKDSKNYDLSQDSGLEITDADSINERKREEQFVSKLMESDFMKKAPILSQYRMINKGSERAYSGFLNNIRFNLFEQGVKELEMAGYTFTDNPKMFKALATTINNLTGRGPSATGNTNKVLNFLLFSPKMLTSRIALIYDLIRTDIPANSPSRKMAAKSLLGTITWVALFNVLGTMAANAFDDDDDDVLDGLNKNPIATDFAKVRDKQTTFDPTAGYAPLVRTLARIITEKSINASGKEKDLSKGYGQTRFSPFWDFMENKLSPIASYGLSLLTHKNPQNKFEDASKAEWNDYITPLFVPLQAMLLVENFNDKDSFGKDFIETVLSLYGIGVAQYDNTSKGNKNANSQTGNRRTERDNTARTTNRRTER